MWPQAQDKLRPMRLPKPLALQLHTPGRHLSPNTALQDSHHKWDPHEHPGIDQGHHQDKQMAPRTCTCPAETPDWPGSPFPLLGSQTGRWMTGFDRSLCKVLPTGQVRPIEHSTHLALESSMVPPGQIQSAKDEATWTEVVRDAWHGMHAVCPCEGWYSLTPHAEHSLAAIVVTDVALGAWLTFGGKCVGLAVPWRAWHSLHWKVRPSSSNTSSDAVPAGQRPKFTAPVRWQQNSPGHQPYRSPGSQLVSTGFHLSHLSFVVLKSTRKQRYGRWHSALSDQEGGLALQPAQRWSWPQIFELCWPGFSNHVALSC